jgi:hypothetical protein
MEHSACKADIGLMDICFNELSVFPHAAGKFEANRFMILFAETARTALRWHIKNIRTDLFTNNIMICSGYSMHDWLFDPEFATVNRNCRDFLIGMIKPPFIPETKEDAYLSAEYYFEDQKNNIEKIKCQGLAAAYLTDTLSIGFQNGPAWSKAALIILMESGATLETKSICNVFSPDSFTLKETASFISERLLKELGDSYLPRTDLLPQQKECHISDDHGKDKLRKFWESLKKSPYVQSAMSTDFSPQGTHFIREIEPNGDVGVVLLSKDPPYTLRVKTTGRCGPETKRIAELLEGQYS